MPQHLKKSLPGLLAIIGLAIMAQTVLAVTVARASDPVAVTILSENERIDIPTAATFKLGMVPDELLGGYMIYLELDKANAKTFAELTRRNIDKPVEVAAGCNVTIKSVIKAPITSGRMIISNNLTVTDAAALMEKIRLGSPSCPRAKLIHLPEKKKRG